MMERRQEPFENQAGTGNTRLLGVAWPRTSLHNRWRMDRIIWTIYQITKPLLKLNQFLQTSKRKIMGDGSEVNENHNHFLFLLWVIWALQLLFSSTSPPFQRPQWFPSDLKGCSSPHEPERIPEYYRLTTGRPSRDLFDPSGKFENQRGKWPFQDHLARNEQRLGFYTSIAWVNGRGVGFWVNVPTIYFIRYRSS